jgi:sodium-dependent dicarboxylate transporter 2/3/5
LAWLILLKVQQVRPTDFDAAAARAGIGEACPWSTAEKRLVPLIAVVVAAWISLPFIATLLPKDSLTDGTIAIAGALLLFVIPTAPAARS